MHLQQVDKLWHPATLFHHLLKVEVWIRNEFVNGLLVRENAILVRLLVLKDAQVRLTWHKKPLLHDIDKAETKEVQRNMHEVWR